MTSWTTPKTWTATTLSVSDMNTHVRDNENYVKERLSHYLNLATTDTTVSNTAAADQTLWSTTVAGNEMTSTGLMIFRSSLVIVNNKGTSGTHTIKFFIGANSVTLFGGAVTDNNATTNIINLELVVRGDGTTSSQRIFGSYTAYTNAVAGAAPVSTTELTTATDITTSQTWKLTVTLSAASASFTCTSRFAGITYNLAAL